MQLLINTKSTRNGNAVYFLFLVDHLRDYIIFYKREKPYALVNDIGGEVTRDAGVGPCVHTNRRIQRTFY